MLQPWAVTLLYFSFPISELGIIRGLISWVVMRIKRVNPGKVLKTVLAQIRISIHFFCFVFIHMIFIKDMHIPREQKDFRIIVGQLFSQVL